MPTVPLSGTNIRLLKGVPFSNDYKHTRWTSSVAEQQAYFQSREIVHTINQANFQRMDGKTFIRVDKSIDELFNVNYMRFQNSDYSLRWFYAFVTKLEYVQRNATDVHFEIDVLQTWRFDLSFKPSFVVREHCTLWNDDGSPVTNTVDEGLNYGAEYDTVSTIQYTPKNDIYFLVIISKRTIHTDPNYIAPTQVGVVQPLTYYLHPFKLNNDPVTIATAGSASTTGLGTLFDLNPIADILTEIYTNEDAVGEVVSLYITEHCGLDVVYNDDVDGYELQFALMEKAIIGVLPTLYIRETHNGSNMGFSPYTEFDCADKYLGYSINGQSTFVEQYALSDGDPDTNRVGLESKLMMYPYSFTTLEDNKGNHIILKNEYIADPNLRIKVYGSMGLSNKVAYIPYQYNGNDDILFIGDASAYEYALINDAPMDVSIINDYLAAYLQGHKNSMQVQQKQIKFDAYSSMIGGGINGVTSATAGMLFGGMPTAIAGGAGGALATVKGAAHGILELQSMMAQVQDARATPPTLQKMGSNTAFDFGNHFTGFFVKKKQIKPEYQKKLSDFFKLYGYKVNEVKLPKFKTRQSWNYVQTQSCFIVGNFNAEDMRDIKAVFDGGITLWHTDDIGNYDLDNQVSGDGVISPDTTLPTFEITPEPGEYSDTQFVQIIASETTIIYYTTNGSTPTTASPIKGITPIAVSSSTTIKFIGVDSYGNETPVQFATYAII